MYEYSVELKQMHTVKNADYMIVVVVCGGFKKLSVNKLDKIHKLYTNMETVLVNIKRLYEKIAI